MNGVPRDNKISLTQTAKGIFYLDKLEVSTEGAVIRYTIDKAFEEAQYIKEKLARLNGLID